MKQKCLGVSRQPVDSKLESENNSMVQISKREKFTKKEKRALITGISGQVGSYLAELLLSKKYDQVHGIIRRHSDVSPNNLTHIRDALHLHYGDMQDTSSLVRLINEIKPCEVYNLAGQSHVKMSFELAELTSNVNALGTLRLLEAIRQYEIASGRQIKFYQASTSELFGNQNNNNDQVESRMQSESSLFAPRSPYACSKLFAHSLVSTYRDSYAMFAVCGILFNHESPRRGVEFVTRKISRSVAEISLNLRNSFALGNLDARRDWGHARDYVEAIWAMLQQEHAQDMIVASGESHSVREFVCEAFRVVGVSLKWRGSGLKEYGFDERTGIVRVTVAECHMRPTEVMHLQGDASLARKQLNWMPKTSFKELVREMVLADVELLANNGGGGGMASKRGE